MADPRTHLFANNAHCLLGKDLGAAETSLQLESGKGALFPDPGDGEIFIFTIEDLAQGVREVCYCSKRNGDVLTIERGKEGTSARDWVRSNTVIVQQRITAGTLEWLAQRTAPTVIQLACSDLTTNLTAGVNKGYFRAPHGFQLTDVRASLLEASSSGSVTVDVNKNGVSVLYTPVTIDEGEKTSTTAVTGVVIKDDEVNDDDEITIDIVNAGTGAKGLIVTLIGIPTYRFGSGDDPPPPPPGPWELVFESGLGEGLRGYANEYIGGAGRLISANTDEIAGVYSSPGGTGYWFRVAMLSDSEIPVVPPFTEVQIFEGPDFSGEPRVFLAEDIVDSNSWPEFGKWRGYWDWSTPGENFFEGRDGDVFSCRLIRS